MEPSADASENVRRFERWAGTYERSWVQRYLDHLHQTVLDLAWVEPGHDPPGVVLDVGCGTGRMLRAAGARWPAAQFVGVDPAAAMVEEARRLFPAASIQVAT